jgi:UTP--glucose-1-phosphate uridylyltransferase
MIEKPTIEQAPSNYVACGRYIFTAGIFSSLKTIKADHRGEIQLTDAIQHLLSYESVITYHFRGKRYDCGSKLGYLKAAVEFGLRHAEIGTEFSLYLRNLLGRTVKK